MPWPKDWSTHLGESVVLEGVGANAELGALLQEDGLSIWIEGLEAWPLNSSLLPTEGSLFV